LRGPSFLPHCQPGGRQRPSARTDAAGSVSARCRGRRAPGAGIGEPGARARTRDRGGRARRRGCRGRRRWHGRGARRRRGRGRRQIRADSGWPRQRPGWRPRHPLRPGGGGSRARRRPVQADRPDLGERPRTARCCGGRQRLRRDPGARCRDRERDQVAGRPAGIPSGGSPRAGAMAARHVHGRDRRPARRYRSR